MIQTNPHLSRRCVRIILLVVVSVLFISRYFCLPQLFLNPGFGSFANCSVDLDQAEPVEGRRDWIPTDAASTLWPSTKVFLVLPWTLRGVGRTCRSRNESIVEVIGALGVSGVVEVIEVVRIGKRNADQSQQPHHQPATVAPSCHPNLAVLLAATTTTDPTPTIIIIVVVVMCYLLYYYHSRLRLEVD